MNFNFCPHIHVVHFPSPLLPINTKLKNSKKWPIQPSGKEQSQTEISAELKTPRTTLLSFLVLIIFTGLLSGYRWFLPGPNMWLRVCFCRQAPLPNFRNRFSAIISSYTNESNQNHSLIYTSLKLYWGKTGIFKIFDQLGHWEMPGLK